VALSNSAGNSQDWCNYAVNRCVTFWVIHGPQS
jgi:hypothetical protein